MECKTMIKDEEGRKTTLQHFHFINFDSLKRHKLVLCVNCVTKIDSLKDIQFIEDSESVCEINDICKKGRKILSCCVEKDNEYLTSKFKEYQNIEGKEFVKEITKDSKKSIFSMIFEND